MQGAVLEESKLALRRAMLSRRAAVSPTQRQFWSALIQAAALKFGPYLAAAEVALYSSIENEVDTKEIVTDALARKKKVFYPKIGVDDSAWFFEIRAEGELGAGRFGISEPAAMRPLSLLGSENLKSRIVFAPAVAFDLNGRRLGRGGGWYDRLLASMQGHAVFVGLAFEFQIVEQLATDEWDQRVHYIITEKRVIDCDVLAS
jgi:5-formyltetrahydrofolate cyclo-ligase